MTSSRNYFTFKQFSRGRVICLRALVVGCLGMTYTSSAWADVPKAVNMADVSDDAPTGPPNTPRVTASSPLQVNVTTYHYDNRRNGWNNAESVLTASNVAGGLNLLHSVPVDEEVDAQPLVLTRQNLAGQGIHDVVYVATENNTVYAIDSNSGAVLLKQNFGTPVPYQMLPGGCNNGSATVGINSTPVIDTSSNTIYLITYTLESGLPVYRLHALNPSTLTDVVPSKIVSATQTLSNGSTYSFQPKYTRQRPALLAVNGHVYAGFGSFCDFAGNLSRGWILGWKENSFSTIEHLNDDLATSPNTFFMSAVWMSGYGLAAEGSDNLFFATGNSDPSGTTYTAPLNLSQSIIKMSLDLSTVKDYFTPSNVSYLDQQDQDIGAAGVMAVPTQSGSTPYLIVGGSKQGNMYLLNRLFMGGHNTNQDHILGTFKIGACWCGPSYFVGADGVGRIVSSGNNELIAWRIQTTPTTTLIKDFSSISLPNSVQLGGFFTAISSNGTQAGTAVIWGVRRPTDNTTKEVTLYAFDGTTGKILTSQVAGTWPYLTGNANIVPVVANGQVFVASYKQLAIFGLGAPGASIALVNASGLPPIAVHRVSGRIVKVDIDRGSFTMISRAGKHQVVLTEKAHRSHTMIPVINGTNVEVQGSFNPDGTLSATVVAHAKTPEAWSEDK